MSRKLFLNNVKGSQGEKGDKPKHQWNGSSLRFENPDGTWGEERDLFKPREPARVIELLDFLPQRKLGVGSILDSTLYTDSPNPQSGGWNISFGGNWQRGDGSFLDKLFARYNPAADTIMFELVVLLEFDWGKSVVQHFADIMPRSLSFDRDNLVAAWGSVSAPAGDMWTSFYVYDYSVPSFSSSSFFVNVSSIPINNGAKGAILILKSMKVIKGGNLNEA